MNTIGARIKKLRQDNNMTQKELAEKMSVRLSTISNYETGYSTPDINTLAKLATIFDTSIDYLAGKSEVSSNRDPLLEGFPEGVQILRRANRELTPEAKAKMIEIANIFIDSVNAKENEEKNK
ncbi:helix-turn-helix domain-containing protein [Peptoniphilus sp. EMRHCC_23]|uniref:helix-turn-helix domain-containing protein n=1 Tax=Peptoniphilus rachelemmaiella TaxID=2811779 RepID=UPI001C007C97|nr:helix-turn-helix domain-containing protein [Peptoniphilus rachelemmaiella]